MIIQFTIGNFLSFKEQSTLSLAASALKEVQVPAEDIIFSVGIAGLSLMKSAVVYGANASGKSNFIKAFEFFKWYVINLSKDIQAGERVNIESFRFQEALHRSRYFSKQEQAINHAKTIIKQFDGNNPAQQESSTTVYLLVEELNKFL